MMIYIQSIDSQEERSKFEELYSRYRDVMLWTAGKLLSNWADAEDAVHQAFVSVIENLHKISQPESPETRAFLIIITERKAIDILRDKKHFSSAELDLTAPGLELPRLKDSALASALAGLPAMYRQVIVLRYAYGFSAEEPGRILGRSGDAVYKLTQRAKAALRKKLEVEAD